MPKGTTLQAGSVKVFSSAGTKWVVPELLGIHLRKATDEAVSPLTVVAPMRPAPTKAQRQPGLAAPARSQATGLPRQTQSAYAMQALAPATPAQSFSPPARVQSYSPPAQAVVQAQAQTPLPMPPTSDARLRQQPEGPQALSRPSRPIMDDVAQGLQVAPRNLAIGFNGNDARGSAAQPQPTISPSNPRGGAAVAPGGAAASFIQQAFSMMQQVAPAIPALPSAPATSGGPGWKSYASPASASPSLPAPGEMSSRLNRANELQQRLLQERSPASAAVGSYAPATASTSSRNDNRETSPAPFRMAPSFSSDESAPMRKAPSFAPVDGSAPMRKAPSFAPVDGPAPLRMAPSFPMVQCADGSYAAADGAQLPSLSEHIEEDPVAPHTLRVLTKENRWEELAFYGHTDFDEVAADFLKQYQLRAAFRGGLADAMRQMAASGQSHHSVDIIDLL